MGPIQAVLYNLPTHPYDFIFIDGPTTRDLPDGSKTFNSDVINILVNATPGQRIDA